MFHDHLDYFQKPRLGGRPNTKLGDHGTPNTHHHLFIVFYHVWRPARIKISLKIAFGWGFGHIWLHTTWFWRWLGTAFGHFVLGSYNFMVTALGSCVKWPLVLSTLLAVALAIRMWTYYYYCKSIMIWQVRREANFTPSVVFFLSGSRWRHRSSLR
jgi:hypothetical protein